MNRALTLYLHAHQPWRLRGYTIFDAAKTHNYFDTDESDPNSNIQVLRKVAAKSYLPTNRILLKLLHQHPEFKVNLSITGTLLEQLEAWAPEALFSFQELAATGRLEIVAETYYHSLAFFYDRAEFERQVRQHAETVQRLFKQTSAGCRNTDVAYNNELPR